MRVVVFWDLVCFPVGSADMNMRKLIGLAGYLFFLQDNSISAVWLGGLHNTTSSEMQ